MDSVAELARQFLALPSIAVVGISSSKENVANAVCRKLRTASRTVYAVGRNSATFDNAPCFPDLSSLPGSVEGVFIAVRSAMTQAIVDECITLNIRHVWMHNMKGTSLSAGSSASEAALRKCRENNIIVIPGACPMMFCENADIGHRCMKWFLSVTGNLT